MSRQTLMARLNIACNLIHALIQDSSEAVAKLESCVCSVTVDEKTQKSLFLIQDLLDNATSRLIADIAGLERPEAEQNMNTLKEAQEILARHAMTGE